ncbi:DUF5997 family protein [Ruania halotolerans]|uniref:DUF5997 family protein n=1 Tax=Ruania halotolerans TaxID=2897773 RepID=UPI001E30511C|nr:DUF5997 family protein [Ruania halotolerans]UFU05842.1 DUF5997 family protein [Ruania halotolerans]
MPASDAAQRMKPITAAKKLGIYLPAAPEEFQHALLTRPELDELERNPPDWLTELRRHGPHPRPVVAGRLAVSISGLLRAGVTEALTTDEINALRADPPEWLVRERAIHEEVVAEDEQQRQRAAESKRAKSADGATPGDAAT